MVLLAYLILTGTDFANSASIELSDKKWNNDEIRKEMILCTEGICVMAQLASKLYGKSYETAINVKDWMRRFK